MKISNILFTTCILLVMSSCVVYDRDGRKWVSTKEGKFSARLPWDPARQAFIDPIFIGYYERKQAALHAAVSRPQEAQARRVPLRTAARNELPPPPAGYMFSSRMTPAGGYEIRGVTGRPQRLQPEDYQELVDQCREFGWNIWRFQ